MTTTTKTCPECGREATAGKYCHAHYYRLKRTGSLGTSPIQRRRKSCREPGCTDRHHGGGWCMKHYHQRRRAAARKEGARNGR